MALNAVWSALFAMSDPLARHAAEIALRLAAIPEGELRKNPEALDAVEQLALKILDEVSAAKADRCHKLGGRRGVWPAMQPPKH
jgi:hypothetical protein